MLNDVHMGGVVGDEIVSLPCDNGHIAAHPSAITPVDFISAFSALPTPMETDMNEHIHIPPEAVEAAENAYCEAWDRDEPALLAAILAALAAWPGVNTDAVRCGTIILHLPKENPDAEA